MTEKGSTRADLLAKLDAVLQESIASGVPGLSAAICTSKGTLWESIAGLCDIKTSQPVDKSHLFGIGSITKVFVTVVILQLVEEGKLKLSDTAGKFLSPEQTSGIENAREATVALLLSHEAGVDSWEDEPSWIVKGRGRAIDPASIWGKTKPLDYIRRPRAIAPEPGQWYYSNTNFTLLGLIIEAIMQDTAESEIRRRILEPLAMDHTHLEGFEKPHPGVVPRRYHWNTDAFRDSAGISPAFSALRSNLIDVTGSNLSTEWAAGGMISSPLDLLKFAMALRHGGLLSPTSLATMQDWRPTTASGEMGHGLFRLPASTAKDRWLGHFGSVLGFSGALWWQEKGDCGICVLSNVGTVHAGSVPSSAGHLIMKSEILDIASQLAALD